MVKQEFDAFQGFTICLAVTLGLSRSSDWRRMFCLLLKSLLSHVRMSCGVVDEARVADYNTEMIVTWIRNSAASCIPEEIRECMYDCVKIWADEKKRGAVTSTT